MANTNTKAAGELRETWVTEGVLKVDRENSTVSHVKVIGLQSRNNRRYPLPVLREARQMYEGAKVNVDHGKQPGASRSYHDRFATLHGIYEKADGLYAEKLKYNPKHPIAEQFAWDAENSPQSVALSHNVMARSAMEGSTMVVESITKVLSVDLVGDPGTTNGLFESEENYVAKKSLESLLTESTKHVAGFKAALSTANVDFAQEFEGNAREALGSLLQEAAGDKAATQESRTLRVRSLSQAIEDLVTESNPDPKNYAPLPKEGGSLAVKEDESSQIVKAVQTLTERLDRYESRDRISSICESHGVAVTDQLLQTLTACENDQEVEFYLHSKGLVGTGKVPNYRESSTKIDVDKLDAKSIFESARQQPDFAA